MSGSGGWRAPFFVLRSPLRPYDALAPASVDLQAPAAVNDPDRLDAALATDRARLRERLAQVVGRPEVRDALFIASPDLESSLPFWHADPDSDRGSRVERALIRYLERLAARATPFGLFAGCAVGTIGERTSLRLPDPSTYQRHTRLDMHYLCALIDALERDPAIQARLRFRPNSSLCRFGDRWHWVQLTPNDEASSHRFRRRDTAPWLDRLVDAARAGLTVAEIAALLPTPDRDAPAIPELQTLLDQQLLVSDLQPAVTGPEPIHALIARLEELSVEAPLAAAAAQALRRVRDTLQEIDAAGLGADPARYRELAALLDALPAKVDRARLFQGELVKTAPSVPANGETAADGTTGLVLGSEVLAEIERGIEVLRRLARPRPDSLARFRNAFVQRYEGVEARREVSLVEVLDAEADVEFGSSTGHDEGEPLVFGLEIPAASDERSVRHGSRHTLLFAKVADALSRGELEISLTERDVELLEYKEPLSLPDAYSVTAVLAASSPEAVAHGDFRLLLQGAAGPSGARMLGRFSHGDPVLRDRVQAYLQAEEALHPDVVFAEIAHLPEPRAGNILHRPVFRQYEITYLSVSGAPLERQIPIADLLVSVEGERIVVRSARLGCEVIPRLTSAQNYFHVRTTRLYRFLAALQDQGIATGTGWDWGPLGTLPFLPRVTFGRLVLARAQWRMHADEISSLRSRQGADLFRAVQAWRKRRALPRHVRVVDYDNELLIDLDNVLSVASFGQLVKGRDQATLVEALPGPDDLCVSGPDGRFFHELSIPYLSTHAPVTAGGQTPGCPVGGSARSAVAPAPSATGPAPLRRVFPPGSEWLYAKLYAPPSMADRLLREVVRPLVDRALGTGAADGWFFIRYADPHDHLRLRFHGDPGRLHAEVLPALHAVIEPLIEDRRIRRLQLDTYDRELERYGGPVGMPLCERVFQADSEAVLAIVEACEDSLLAQARWKLAVVGLDLLLEGLGFDLGQKLAVLRRVRESFAREHHADQKLLRQIGERYRAERRALDPLFGPAEAVDGPLGAGLAALHRRSESLGSAMAELRRTAADGALTLSLEDLAPSFLHMHANRLLRTRQRTQEMVLYDFLCRLYEAREARQREASS